MPEVLPPVADEEETYPEKARQRFFREFAAKAANSCQKGMAAFQAFTQAGKRGKSRPIRTKRPLPAPRPAPRLIP